LLNKLTLSEVLNRSAKKFSINTALSSIEGISITYKELKEKVNSVSKFLRENGILPGDKVIILSENCVNWGVAYFAITTMGSVCVPIMTEFKSTEIKHIILHSEAKAIFVSSKQYQKIEKYDSDELNIKILLDDFSIIPANAKTDTIKSVLQEGLKEFQKIKFAALKIVGLTDDEVKENDLALILYTSGTTGHSKGVMLTHKNITYDATETAKLVNINEDDRMLSILPLYHTYEATLGLVTPMIGGASVYYLNKPPTPAVLLPALKKVKPTVMLSVPLVIEKIFRNKVLSEINKKGLTRNLYKFTFTRKKINRSAGKKLADTFGGNLRLFCIGGSGLAADVETFLQEAKFPYSMGYGLTETSPLVTGTDNLKVKYGSAGSILNGMQIKINNPDSETGEGEVLIKGANVMQGYFKDPEKTEGVFTKDGWFRSGDLGVVDDDGYLFLKGRSKNVIIGSNGKNIYPEEIEAIISEQMYVEEALIIDREGKLEARIHLNYEQIDVEYGIHKKNESEARKIIDDILANIFHKSNERLNTFSKLSRYVEQVEPFEKTPTKKIKRFLYS